MGHDVERHAGAVVGDAERDILTRRQFPLLRRAIVQPLVGGLDRQSTALRHRIACVDAQIEQRVLKLVGIDERRPEAAGADDQVNRRPDRAPDQFFHPSNEPIDVGRLGIERLPSRKRE